MTRLGGSRLQPLQVVLAGILGAGAALLVACGGSGSAKLIPAQNASQLKSDFDAVASEVASGNCDTGLKAAVAQTRTDLNSLPPTLDPRLAGALQTGLRTLTARANSECKPQTTTTPTTSTPTTSTPTNTNTNTNTNTTPTNTDTNTTPTVTTPTDTNTTPTDTTPVETTPTIIPGTGGGTPAPSGQGSTGSAASTGSAGSGGGTLGGGN